MSNIQPQSFAGKQSLNETELNDLKLIATEVRKLILKMVTGAQSGHVGGSLSATELLVTLYCHVMTHGHLKQLASDDTISNLQPVTTLTLCKQHFNTLDI